MYRHGRENLRVNRPWELMAFVKTIRLTVNRPSVFFANRPTSGTSGMNLLSLMQL